MDRFVALLAAGIAQGAIVAIVALGFLLIYRATGAINFAQGELVTLGAYVAIWASVDLELNLITAYALAVAVLFVVGVALERFAYAPIRDRSIHVVVISTLGASVVIRAGIAVWQGAQPKRLASPLGLDVWRVAGARIPMQNVLIVGVTVLALAVVMFVFARTGVGRQLRALAADRMAAQLQGIRTRRMSMLAFGASASLSALAGVLIAPRVAVTVGLGFSPMLQAFAAAILGGFGNLWGVVVGALAIGLAQQLGAGYIDPGYADLYPFVLMIAVIATRPSGLFGGVARARL